jgi:magnesium transporter
MLTAFVRDEKAPECTGPAATVDALRSAIWIDLLHASHEETARVREATGLAIPERARMEEIESSSRLSTHDGVLYLNMPLVSLADGPRAVALGFVLTPERLITVRFAPSRSFEHQAELLRREGTLGLTGVHVFVNLMESVIDRQADALEGVRSDLERISQRIFRLGAEGHGGRRDEDLRMRRTLSELGTIGDLVSHIQDTQVAAARIVPYVEAVSAAWIPKDIRTRLRTLRRDIASVNEFGRQLNDKLQFMLDATLGFINIAQNNLMKVMTIASVAGIPPVLVAGIYGMNFRLMPELDWTWGYAWGLGLIMVSTLIPLALFRWRRWI